MNNPKIKHRVCEYNGRLWVIESVKWKTSYTALDLRLVDGDDVCFAEMTQEQYLKFNSTLKEQEFSITPPSPAAEPAYPPEGDPRVIEAFGLTGFVPPNAPPGFKGYGLGKPTPLHAPPPKPVPAAHGAPDPYLDGIMNRNKPTPPPKPPARKPWETRRK